MAPRENAGNGGDEPKPEKSIATLSTLRYSTRINTCNTNGLIADGECRIGVKAMIEKVGFASLHFTLLHQTPLPIHKQPAD
jgi:hypothetical protein